MPYHKIGEWVRINDISGDYPAYDGKVGQITGIVLPQNMANGRVLTVDYPYHVTLVDEPYPTTHPDHYDQWCDEELELITDEQEIFLYKLGKGQ